MREKPKIFCYLLITVLLLQSSAAFAWTTNGHTYINQVAAEKIPASMPLFLRQAQAVAEIAYLGPEPDRWRDPTQPALADSQSPDHFIKLELISWMNPLPPNRYQFYRELYAKRAETKDNPNQYLPENVGLQPYIVAEVYGRLVDAFRAYRKLLAEHKSTAAVGQAIIFYAGWLGHYVADGSQPLHTSIQIDGWVGPNPHDYTTKHGIHLRFESDYVNANIKAADFSGQVHAPEELAHPLVDYFDYLKSSNQLVEDVYRIDKAGGFNGKGSPEAFKFTTGRLAAGSQMLLDLWYTAWLESGVPETLVHSASAFKTQSK